MQKTYQTIYYCSSYLLQVPPKFHKNPVKQQFYQQQYFNELLRNLNSKSNKYNVIAIKSKYYNVPYYVVSNSNICLILFYNPKNVDSS